MLSFNIPLSDLITDYSGTAAKAGEMLRPWISTIVYKNAREKLKYCCGRNRVNVS